MNKKFIGEPLGAVSSDTSSLASGEPGPPLSFRWRDQAYGVAEVIDKWKGVDADRTHGSSEQYVHKHWFKVRATDGAILTIYFERQPRSRSQATTRWWFYSLE